MPGLRPATWALLGYLVGLAQMWALYAAITGGLPPLAVMAIAVLPPLAGGSLLHLTRTYPPRPEAT